jgi:hypothetical protein
MTIVACIKTLAALPDARVRRRRVLGAATREMRASILGQQVRG